MAKETRNRVGLAILLIALVLFAGGLTFAFFRADVTEDQEKLTIQTGTLALTFSDNNTGITASELQLGDSTSKEFSIKNTGSLPVTTNMLWNNLINTYLKESMSYTFQYKTSEAGEWETTLLASGNIPRSATPQDFNLAENITVPVGATYYYKLTITFNNLDNVNQTIDTGARLISNFKLGNTVTLSNVDKTLLALGKFKKEGTPDFATTATEDETADGLYSMADDYGTSYYYRGAVEDNYVKFGGFYWRIIRVNGDGSLRMIYDGTVAHKNGKGNETFTTTGENNTTTSSDRFINSGAPTAFNINYNDNAFVGWMYGTPASDNYDSTHRNTTNSTMKNLIDDWYDTNLTSYDQYIADAVYCNDRSTPGTEISKWSYDTGLGYNVNETVYGATARVADASSGAFIQRVNPTPQFTCPHKNDAFTVSDSIHGNAIGTIGSRKIGLLTVDENVAAGGVYKTTNRNYYLYKSSNFWYWLFSPCIFHDGFAGGFGTDSSGKLTTAHISDGTYGAVAPVISIKAEYATQLVGNGTTSSPFQIPGVA